MRGMLATLLTLLAATAAAAEGDVIHEALDKPPESPWSWVREEPAGLRVAEGKTLEIAALRGTLWKKDRNDAKNLLVRPWPADAGDSAEISVTVTFAPQSGGEQAGVMLYVGDD